MTGPTTTAAMTTRLREWRVAAGFSLAEASGLTGISAAMWSRAERGERRFAPKTKVLIARRLGVAVSDLFEAEDPEAPAS